MPHLEILLRKHYDLGFRIPQLERIHHPYSRFRGTNLASFMKTEFQPVLDGASCQTPVHLQFYLASYDKRKSCVFRDDTRTLLQLEAATRSFPQMLAFHPLDLR
ncbi:hypothetical protein GJ744_010801 [Endocarpon pusillum]|uniref:Uncharacterized protein n=1 Tax=Endocarpon pusillum TaxID=364733 RepID=A0A8H7ADR6_9EURO|nr:hypothetical protein GJ744_010801 [Endocarpon pusillum]